MAGRNILLLFRAPMIPAATIVLLVVCAAAWVWTEVDMRLTDRRP